MVEITSNTYTRLNLIEAKRIHCFLCGHSLAYPSGRGYLKEVMHAHWDNSERIEWACIFFKTDEKIVLLHRCSPMAQQLDPSFWSGMYGSGMYDTLCSGTKMMCSDPRFWLEKGLRDNGL